MGQNNNQYQGILESKRRQEARATGEGGHNPEDQGYADQAEEGDQPDGAVAVPRQGHGEDPGEDQAEGGGARAEGGAKTKRAGEVDKTGGGS